jgi:hypothetical protein
VRRFDHAVLCVPDLDAARRRYAELGFTLTPPAQHPFGTANSLVQFANDTFIELLAVVDPSRFPAEAPGHFGFAHFNERFLRGHGAGMTMLVFASDDARADAASFAQAGLDAYAPFDFTRAATLPDGSRTQVSFSLAFVTHPAMPDAAFFTCQQRHAREAFWQPAYQAHANGAGGIVGVEMAADRPEEFAQFLGRLTGAAAAMEGDALVCGPPGNRLLLHRQPGAATRFVALQLAGFANGPVDAAGVTLRQAG